MTSSINSPRTAVVCMVHNGYEYISEFLLYHLNLVDHIYIIDHNSDRDLRQLEIDRVTIVRSNHEAQFQSECTNIVIEHFKIKERYDWLFVLDIDEFLPFVRREALSEFLREHQKNAAIQLQWHNGVPFYHEADTRPESLIDVDSIRFFKHPGKQHKSIVNIKYTRGRFFIPTGAHHTGRISRKFAFFNKNKLYRSEKSDLPLYHIVAFNKGAFIKKIQNYITQMKYREHILGQGGWMVRDYPMNPGDDEWLWYIANFRVSSTNDHYETRAEDFIDTPIFAHLDKRSVRDLRDRIMQIPLTSRASGSEEEKTYLLYKKDDRHVMDNIKWFKINPNDEIVNISIH